MVEDISTLSLHVQQYILKNKFSEGPSTCRFTNIERPVGSRDSDINQKKKMNGSVPNAMNQMANGTNGIQRGPENTVDMKAKLNTCIYDYLLRNGEGDVARALKNSSLTIQTVQSPPQRKNNGEDNGEDTKDDLDTKKPVDLPWPADVPAGATDNSFLLDWFQIFWEMFWAQRKDGPKPGPSTTAYMNYQRVYISHLILEKL